MPGLARLVLAAAFACLALTDCGDASDGNRGHSHVPPVTAPAGPDDNDQRASRQPATTTILSTADLLEIRD